MELILLQDVEDVGRKGEVVKVKEGFGRNFLLPQKYALAATRANKKFVDDLKARAEKKLAVEKAEAENMAKKVDGLKVQIERSVGEQGKLFGSVTAEDICEELAKQNYTFRKKQVQLKEPIRSVGIFPVNVEVFPQVKAAISVEVVAKS